MNQQVLQTTAAEICTPGRGILAADESSGTIAKRFASIGTESTEESRRFYREMLFTAEGAAQSISGVILFDETLRQSTADGVPFAEVLAEQNVVPGIKVDRGAKPLAGHPGETVTEGLDGLSGRLVEYRELGARFAKWRAVIKIGEGLPSAACIHTNAHALARYAALCQENDIVPIVEPEVLMDGPHTIERCFEVTEETLHCVFHELHLQGVCLEGMLLKPNMVLSGTECPEQAGVEQVAAETLRCFRRTVPAAVPGIMFLSGGQSDLDATAHLDAMNRMAGEKPWFLSYSYGRALQAAALKAWSGKPANRDAGQRAFLHRAGMNGAAQKGAWKSSMEEALQNA